MAPPVQRDQELELRIDFLAFGGNGVARLDGFVVFVRRGLPGDTVRARVTKVQRRHAEAVLTERPYKLRAVFAAGNPLIDSANITRVRKAYEQLELFVYPTLFMEEPAAYADYILPVASVWWSRHTPNTTHTAPYEVNPVRLQGSEKRRARRNSGCQ